MDLVSLYRIWSETVEACTCELHASPKYKNQSFEIKPEPDSVVCLREQRWRRYVEARDGKPQGTLSSVYTVKEPGRVNWSVYD
jgi:hypothetical protein